MAPRTHSQSHPTYTIHHLETLTLLSANSSTTTTTTPTTATTPCTNHTNHDNHNSQANSLHLAASTLAVSAPMAGKLLHAAGDELVAVAAGRRHLTPLHHNNSQPHEYNHHKQQPQLQPQQLQCLMLHVFPSAIRQLASIKGKGPSLAIGAF